jgi:hypothetical protein
MKLPTLVGPDELSSPRDFSNQSALPTHFSAIHIVDEDHYMHDSKMTNTILHSSCLSTPLARTETALHLATSQGQTAILQILLHSGVHVDS